MKNKKMLIISIIIIFTIIIIGINFILNNSSKNADALKFKEEYESLNGVVNSPNKEYKKLNISKNNPIKYSSYDELLNIIKNGTGIIYLGFPACPWCRTALPVLFEAASANKIDTIYYLNILDERDTYTVEDGKLVYMLDENGNEKKGSEGYFKLLEVLDENLTEYTITYEGTTYKTGEKRIYAPSVIFVRDGKIIDIHVSTVEGQKSGYDSLTEEQYQELYNIYEDNITKMLNTTCSIGSSC